MARRGISISTFYRDWKRNRLGEADHGPMHPPVLMDASFPGVIRRDELDKVLAAERWAEAAAIRSITRPPVAPTYAELRAAGKSDLQVRREIAGLTLSEVALAIGTSGMRLAQMENGTRKATPDMLAGIEAALSKPHS